MIDFTIRRENDKYNGRIIWSEDQIHYVVTEYKNGTTMKELGRRFNVQYETIRRLLRKEKVQIDGYKHGYPRKENIFSKIDSKEKAYWLGVLYADGKVSNNNYEISLGLSDKEHIEKFQKFLGATNHKIAITVPNKEKNKLTKNFYSLSIKDKKIHDDLIYWGCYPNKSHLDLHIPNIKENFIIDFIRGYFDGDGGFWYAKNKIKKDRLIIAFSGSKTLLQEIASFLHINTSLEKNIKAKNTYCLKTNKKDLVREIVDRLYEGTNDSIRLNRKYQIYLNYLGA